MPDLLKLRPQGLTIILDDLDFSWHDWEIEEAVFLWESGLPLTEMVDRLRPQRQGYAFRPREEREAEVVMLLVQLGLWGRITHRKGGVFGVWNI